MNIKLHQSRLRTIYREDADFMLVDNFVTAPRAGFHIIPECPSEYRLIIAECINKGWLKPVATVYDYEQVFDTLAN